MSEKLRVYPWTVSSTGQYSVDTGLLRLRDDPPEVLANWIWESGIYVQQITVREFLSHGEPRKAAGFVRELVKQHPEFESRIRGQYGPLQEFLFDLPLNDVPATPQEFAKYLDKELEYVQ